MEPNPQNYPAYLSPAGKTAEELAYKLNELRNLPKGPLVEAEKKKELYETMKGLAENGTLDELDKSTVLGRVKEVYERSLMTEEEAAADGEKRYTVSPR